MSDYLEKNFFLVSGGEETVDIGGCDCAIVNDAECRTIAFVPSEYAKVVVAALNAYDEEYGIRVAIAELMTESRAREVLSGVICDDDCLGRADSELRAYWHPHSKSVGLDGECNADELEAIAWWMRNKGAK